MSAAYPSAPAVGRDGAPAPKVEHVRRIAVLRANGLGDYIVSEPALTALRAAYPDAEITLLGGAHHELLLAGRPGPVDRVVRVPAISGVRVSDGTPDAPAAEVEDWCRARRAERYDLAVQLHGGGANSNPLLLRLGARVTAGAATADAPRPDRWVPYRTAQHDVVRWLEVAAAAGAPMVRLRPELAVTAHDLDASRAAVTPTSAPLVVVHPGATDARRRYPEDRLGRIAAELASRGARVVVLGGAVDADLVRKVADAFRSVAGTAPEVHVGSLGLPALVGLLARADLMIGNDSGPRHIAAAVGTPTAAVFTYANLADVAPLDRTWHRVLVSWHGGCQVCGMRVLDGWCGHGASATHDVPEKQLRDAVLDLWRQVSEADAVGATRHDEPA